MSLHDDLTHLLLEQQRLRELQGEAVQRRLWTERKAADRAGSSGANRGPLIVGAGLPEHWQATADEIAAGYPSDRFATSGVRALTRAVDIDAPASVTFRWLCQLRVAPYSYDWIDNAGRRSPQVLTPGLDKLQVGQGFGVGTLASFAPDEHITIRALPRAERWFGLVAMTYCVIAEGPCASRIVVRLLVHRPARSWEHLRVHVLAWGDLIMMRKQLLRLKRLAEQTARHPANEHLARERERA